MKKEKDTKPPKPVYCGHCCNGVRDTEGRSFSIVTGEYFMGKCLRGHGEPFKVFMDKARACDDYNIPIPLTEEQQANKETTEDQEDKIVRQGRTGKARQEDNQALLFDA